MRTSTAGAIPSRLHDVTADLSGLEALLHAVEPDGDLALLPLLEPEAEGWEPQWHH
jgi:hypothetical protein